MRRAEQRRGFTLIEVTIASSISMLIAMLCFTLVQQMLRAHRGSLDLQQRLTSLANLSEQFRSDAHAARSQSLAAGHDGSRTLQLDLGERRTASYSLANGSLERVEREGDSVHRREQFRLAGWSVAKLDVVLRELPLAAVVLRLGLPADADNRAPRPRELRIEAVLGLDALSTQSVEVKP